jgi:hypothetical protein
MLLLELTISFQLCKQHYYIYYRTLFIIVLNMAPTTSDTQDVPDRFICPLTLQVMRYPIQHKQTKHNFEREALFEWLFVCGKSTCPLTRMEIIPSQFQDNLILKREIQEWKLEHDVSDHDHDDDGQGDDDQYNKELLPGDQIISQARKPVLNEQVLNLRKHIIALREEKLKQCVVRNDTTIAPPSATVVNYMSLYV